MNHPLPTAAIPALQSVGARPVGERFEPPPKGTIKRSVTVLCTREEARDAWQKMEFTEDALFSEAPGDRGTIVTVTIPDEAPETALGAAFATLMRNNPADAVAKALMHYKAQLETGEIPTTDGQPSGKKS